MLVVPAAGRALLLMGLGLRTLLLLLRLRVELRPRLLHLLRPGLRHRLRARLLHRLRMKLRPWLLDLLRRPRLLRRLWMKLGARLLNLRPDQVMMGAAHNGDLAAARGCGLQTAFFPRPGEYGPKQDRDTKAEQDWDIVAADIQDMAAQLGV